MFVEDALLLGLWIQQVCDELLKRWRDPGCKRLRRSLGQTARHVTVAMQHDGTKLPVEVFVGPLRKDRGNTNVHIKQDRMFIRCY